MAEDFDETKLDQLIGNVIGDVAGARTGYNRKYLHEWLGSMAAAGYVTLHAEDATFSLTPEQALVFTREGQPACMQGFFQAVVSQYEANEQAVETFKSGKGRPWSDQTPCCFCGTDRFFRPGYAANMVETWIPSLSGVDAKLKAGAKVADIACGHGSTSTRPRLKRRAPRRRRRA